MFFIIWGVKTYSATLGMVTLACRNGHTAAHRLVRTTRKFTLFFIPLFPVGKRYYSVCTMCGEQVQWTKEEMDEMVHRPGTTPALGDMGGRPFDPVAAPVNPFGPGPAITGPVAVSGPPAGWYPDPSGQEQQRWWDGRGWTEMVQQPAPPI